MRELAVVGFDPRFHALFEQIDGMHDVVIRPLLAYERVRKAPSYNIDALLDDARRELAGDGVAGITTFWDFPSSCIVPILAEEQGLPTPGLRAVVAFEHKYWSRLIQQHVAPDDTPTFALLDVFDEQSVDSPPLPYPFWLKPVKSYGGHLGFRIRSDDEYRDAIRSMRRDIRRIGTPFQAVLDRVDGVPDVVAAAGGSAAIAEAIIEGSQCTLEGHVHAGVVSIHGIFDIHRGQDRSTFTHYIYPSELPTTAHTKMCAIATGLIEHVGYDNAAFNIEFFVDVETGRTWILEVNTRISQEHSYLMHWVDGATNLQIMAQVALGERPHLKSKTRCAEVAAKFFVRRWQDGVVVTAPDAHRVSLIEHSYAPCVVELLVEPGLRLSDMQDQEPYSYLVAYVHLGGHDVNELETRYANVVTDFGLKFDPPD